MVMVRQYLADKARNSRDSEAFVSERDLAKELNISRNESRKLLAAMEHDGLVRCIPKRGYRVIDYRQVENQTLLNLRAPVEREAARLACKYATREDLARMWMILDEAGQAIAGENLDQFKKLDLEFHQALVDSSHNALVQQMYGILFFQTQRVKPWSMAAYTETHRAHEVIFDAVRARDAEAAQAAVESHIGNKHFNGMVSEGLP